MATQMRSKSQLSANKETKGRQRLTWIVFVGIVPILVAAVVIGLALQVVGVPVWKTTLQLTGIAPAQKNAVSAETQAQNELSVKQKQIAQLDSKNAKLTQKVASQTKQIAALQAQEKVLQRKLQLQESHLHSGQAEAKVLAQMDPKVAVSVLQKMSMDEAAWVIAAMAPNTSGPILQDASPTFVSKVIQQAADDQMLASQAAQNANTTGMGTTP